jgi:L-2-hydroxyglutarate oxidase
VVDKEDAPAVHQTGRNSCVLHAGVYYAPGSLKARLCTRGRRALLDFCDEHGVPYDLTGKLIVATSRRELGRLHELERRARANGLAGLQLLERGALRDVEPHVTGEAGLYVPETGLVDFRLVAGALLREHETGGGTVCLSTPVSSLAETARGVRVETAKGSIEARIAVACAGVYSDRLALVSGARADGAAIVPFRGSYFALAPEVAERCRGLIYPVPDPRLPFLGVHINRRPDGSVWIGPNAVLALAREGYSRRNVDARDVRDIVTSGPFWRLAARHWRAAAVEVTRDLVPALVARAARRLLPGIEREHLVPAAAGIRAQALNPDGTLADDFLFAETARALHVQNAPSPAATSCLAIAEVLAERALAKLDDA